MIVNTLNMPHLVRPLSAYDWDCSMQPQLLLAKSNVSAYQSRAVESTCLKHPYHILLIMDMHSARKQEVYLAGFIRALSSFSATWLLISPVGPYTALSAPGPCVLPTGPVKMDRPMHASQVARMREFEDL